ncbi:hypothetical protein DPEC_G00069580 [Dallia pectoralis]|uniref:Uncharacterized protein n=1 Tax=Dallia pectoralis TaxID=75939 RepID=A0ACC2H1Q8_DALPE|nr:hypothetical protein DPEC_G00069580 [Dallia pectoralis]
MISSTSILKEELNLLGLFFQEVLDVNAKCTVALRALPVYLREEDQQFFKTWNVEESDEPGIINTPVALVTAVTEDTADPSIQIKEEFRRITTVSLEQSFMYKLDHYTTKLMALMTKGGIIGTNLRAFLDRLSQNQSIELRHETVIRSLILGKKEELFEDCPEGTPVDATEHFLKIMVDHVADQEGPVDVSILLEGREVFLGCVRTAKAHC